MQILELSSQRKDPTVSDCKAKYSRVSTGNLGDISEILDCVSGGPRKASNKPTYPGGEGSLIL